jgi:hypothetical protein
LLAPISNKKKRTKRKKKGAWAPSLLKVGDGTHLHPKVKKNKKEKKRELGLSFD